MSYQKIVVNLQDCTEYALKHRPDGISAIYAVKKAEKDIAVVKSNRLPQVNAQVSRTFNGEKIFDNDHNDNWSAGLSISWNVFDNNVTVAQVQENEATLRRLQSAYEQTREKIELDVRKAYNNLIASEKILAVRPRRINRQKFWASVKLPRLPKTKILSASLVKTN